MIKKHCYEFDKEFAFSFQKDTDKPPIFLACEKGKIGKVRKMLDEGTDVNSTWKRVDQSLITRAVIFEKSDIVKLLIEKGADVNSKYGETLCRSVSEAGMDIVRMLLQAGARVNGDYGFENATPLHRAAHIGNADLVKFLISYGADTECRDRNYEKPIHIAGRKGHAECVVLLKNASGDQSG